MRNKENCQRGRKSRMSWQICDTCGIKTRSLRKRKDSWICYKCWRRTKKMIGVGGGWKGFTLEQALAKTYEIQGFLSTNGKIRGHRSFPSILIGHKVKLQLIK